MKVKVVDVSKDHITLQSLETGDTYAELLPPIIYEYKPGDVVYVTNHQFWHKEDIERYEKNKLLIGKIVER